MEDKVIENVSKKINLKVSQIRVVIDMLKGGATIPFMARYRKEATGNLDEDELRLIETEYNYMLNLENRKEDVKRLITEKGLMNEAVMNALNEATKLAEVEDIYAPFKEHRKTKGTEAIKLGLEPLAKIIMSMPNKTREEIAKNFLTDEVKTVDDAMTNAGYIIADWISDNPKYRKYLRNYYYYHGKVTGKLKKGAVDEAKVYEIYYNFETSISRVKPYQVLAMSRASKEGVINYSLSVKKDDAINYLKGQILKKNTLLEEDIVIFIEDAWKRLIEPSLERDIKAELYDNASSFGIKEFGSNLENLLLTPPIKGSVVLGFDPAFRTGCKLAVLSPTGNVLEIGVIYPHAPKNEVEKSEEILLNLIKKHNIKVIAIGNGTASRESEVFVANLIKKYNLDVLYTIVSEAGASIYSASKLAQKEFPDYSVEQRSAVSIGRRLQDSLSELVKIDPKGLGVGLYQHDLKEKDLDEELKFVVEKVVNKVGVNLNNASDSILSYVSGLNKKIINKIQKYKEQKGKIKSREELLTLGMSAQEFENSAGFLRIFDEYPLDKTNIHPEDYKLVNNILSDYDIDVNMVGTRDMELKLNSIKDISKYKISKDKWEMLKENLVNGVIDPRDNIKSPTLRSDVLSIDDLELGMSLTGTVRNVTAFGAFVDIGLHDDGLIHISKLSRDYVKHPSDILKVGDIVEATVCGIDKDKSRVNLSLI